MNNNITIKWLCLFDNSYEYVYTKGYSETKKTDGNLVKQTWDRWHRYVI